MLRFFGKLVRDYLHDSHILDGGNHPSSLVSSEPPSVFSPVPPGTKISSHFGPRNVSGASRNHSGVDFAVPVGTEIRAITDGKVSRTAPHRDFGLMVAILHEDGHTSLYGHLSSVNVKVGDIVRGGDFIGKSGNTGGMSKGPHLHFGIWSEGAPLQSSGGLGFLDSEYALPPLMYMNDLMISGALGSTRAASSERDQPDSGTESSDVPASGGASAGYASSVDSSEGPSGVSDDHWTDEFHMSDFDIGDGSKVSDINDHYDFGSTSGGGKDIGLGNSDSGSNVFDMPSLWIDGSPPNGGGGSNDDGVGDSSGGSGNTGGFGGSSDFGDDWSDGLDQSWDD